MSKIFITKSAAETINLGEKLGLLLSGGELVTLTGDLGGGKTQFTKGIAKSMGIRETVTSPTFTVERIYKPSNQFFASSIQEAGGRRQKAVSKKLTLHHLDLYRTHEDREILEEIEEITASSENVVVIEWPENISRLKGFDRLEVNFEYENEDERKLTFQAFGERYEILLEKLPPE